MILSRGKIPIAIHPLFWLFAGLIGWLSSGTLFGALAWVLIILVSVLFHELGHALTALCFRQTVSIQLVALGGLTSYEGPKLRLWQQFLIVLNGPLFGFGLFLLASLALQWDWSAFPVVFGLIRATQVANLFWSIVNLFPVLPLDGGQLLRIVLEGLFGVRGYRISMLLGALFAAASALLFFLVQQYLAGALFALFGFQSFELWRKSRHIVEKDTDDALKKMLSEAEMKLVAGDRAAAEEILVQMRLKSSQGMLYLAATQSLAIVLAERGEKEQAYALLLPIEKELAIEGRCLLQDLAANQKNWDLVARLSAECYQAAPSALRALVNARAFGALKQPKPAGGWLQTAWQFGNLDLNAVLAEEVFQGVREAPEFRAFVDEFR